MLVREETNAKLILGITQALDRHLHFDEMAIRGGVSVLLANTARAQLRSRAGEAEDLPDSPVSEEAIKTSPTATLQSVIAIGVGLSSSVAAALAVETISDLASRPLVVGVIGTIVGLIAYAGWNTATVPRTSKTEDADETLDAATPSPEYLELMERISAVPARSSSATRPSSATRRSLPKAAPTP
jgi:hypothetical protein